MKKISVLLIATSLLACNNSEKNTTASTSVPTKATTIENTTTESTANPRQEANTTAAPASTGTKKYKGAFFDINYPADFNAEGITPTNQGDEKLYDAAIFSNAEGTVAFYVFSPRHWYEPEGFLAALPYEKQASEEKKENDGIISHYKTFTAKDGSYTRSIHIQLDSKTFSNYVFGIQYKDQATYNKYKDAYLAFKKSLTQYH